MASSEHVRPNGDIMDVLSSSQSTSGNRETLVRTIETEIIPRLMILHATSGNIEVQCVDEKLVKVAVRGEPRVDRSDGLVTDREVVDFSCLLVEATIQPACGYVENLLESGMSWDDVLLNLATPAARHLGEDWNEDRRDFTEVTLGLGTLQRVLRELNPLAGQISPHANEQRRILLAATPGEGHTFGVLVVEDFFRRAGWHVTVEAETDNRGIADAVSRDWYTVIGISLGSETLKEALADLIKGVRKASSNPNVLVLVGGPAFVAEPGIFGVSGADAMAYDALGALSEADRLTKACLAAD
jgi:methanogenic corrinoid protein MtbC1